MNGIREYANNLLDRLSGAREARPVNVKSRACGSEQGVLMRNL